MAQGVITNRNLEVDSNRTRLKRLGMSLIALIIAVLFLFPLYWILISSLKTDVEIFDKNIFIIVDNHARIQDALRVESRFNPLHQSVNFRSPFLLHKRRHISPRSVLGFQAAVVLSRDQICERVHKRGVSIDTFRAVDVGRNREMYVSVKQMPPHHGIGVTRIHEQLAQIRECIGKHFGTKCHVFDNAQRVFRTRSRRRCEQAVAHVPIQVVKVFVGGELYGRECLNVSQSCFDFPHLSE